MPLLQDDQCGEEPQRRLERFISGWNAKRGPPVVPGKNWAEFFNEWRRRAPLIDVARARKNSIAHTSDFAKFAAAFPSAFRVYRESGAMFNTWKNARLGTDERRNCKVLAALLDHSGEHGQGSVILCRLLATIGLLEFRDLAAANRYSTRTEVWPLDDAESRIDIEIEDEKFLIFIEAKIGAVEGKDQLKRYLDLAEIKAANRKWAIIFLTPDGRDSAVEHTVCEERIKPASWTQVSRAVQYSAADCPDGPIRHILSQYAQFVGSL